MVPVPGTDGISYRVSLNEPSASASGKSEFVEMEILVKGIVWREFRIDVEILDGLIGALREVVQMREQARVEAAELLLRIGTGRRCGDDEK